MHIHIVARGCPTDAYPLNGIFEFDQAEALSQAGHKVVIVALDFRSVRRWRKFGLYRSAKNNIEVFNISVPLGNIELPFFNLIARKLVSFSSLLLRRYYGKPDIIHAHFLQISSLSVEIKKRLGAPFVITEHSSQLNVDSFPKQLFKLAKWTYSQADLVIVVSETLKARMWTHFKISSTIVANIVNTNEYSKRKTVNETNNQFTFISVGTLNYNKGFDLLLKAFKNANFSSDIKLKIIGDGELKKSLIDDIDNLGLHENVELLGFQPRTKIFDYYNESNVFVLASRSETFGVVFIEAMLSGLPVIATKCGGPEGLVNEANGVLVPINDVHKLSEALIKMVKTYTNYNSSDISKNAINKFSPQIIAEKLTDLYKQVSSVKSN